MCVVPGRPATADCAAPAGDTRPGPAEGAPEYPAGGVPGMAPDFVLRECVYADSIALADYLGGLLLLVFYDGGLVSNINTLRYANEWHRRYQDDGARIVGIHCPFFEPSRQAHNAMEVVAKAGVTIPVGLDMDRRVYRLYGVTSLPCFVLVRAGGEIAGAVSGLKVYADVERAVQEELKRLNPGVILPLIARPMKPWDDPDARLFEETPLTVLGYGPGNIANADSSLRDRYGRYEDPLDRTRDAVFLQGPWKVGEYSVSHSDSIGGLDNHLRIIYRGKSVWILPGFEPGRKPKVYIKQDRSYLDNSLWGRDILGDHLGKPYIHLQYSIPCQIVDNPTFGTHQLELIADEGDVSFYYLFFETDVQK